MARGIEISIDALEERLGAEVLPTVALERRGVGELPALLDRARRPRRSVTFPAPIEDTLGLLCRLLAGATIPARALAILLLAEAPAARRYVEQHFGKGMVDQVDRLVSSLRRDYNRPLDVVLTESYAATADRIVRQTQRVHQRSPLFMTRFGLWAQQLSTGIPLALAILFAMYLFVGSFGATYLVDLLNNRIFAGILTPIFERIVEPIPSAFVRSALVDDGIRRAHDRPVPRLRHRDAGDALLLPVLRTARGVRLPAPLLGAPAPAHEENRAQRQRSHPAGDGVLLCHHGAAHDPHARLAQATPDRQPAAHAGGPLRAADRGDVHHPGQDALVRQRLRASASSSCRRSSSESWPTGSSRADTRS